MWNKLVFKLSKVVKYNEGMVFMKRRRFLILGLLLVLLTGLYGSTYALKIINNKNTLGNEIKTDLELPVVGSFENLKKLIKSNRYSGDIDLSFTESGTKKSPDSAPTNQPTQAISDYSTTNLQVQGVDESDVVKTDGQYIYQVNSQKVVIIKANPPEKMEIVSRIEFGKSFNPAELYLDKNRLVVIGNSYNEPLIPLPKDGKKPDIINYQTKMGMYTVKAMVYDITRRSKPELIRELEIEGGMVSSRRIDSKVYIVSNSYIYNYFNQNSEETQPVYRDSVKGKDYIKIDFSSIQYFPEYVSPNYMIIASIDINDSKKEAQISTYLGSGQDIYVSNNNLYVALPKHEKTETIEPQPKISVPAIGVIVPGFRYSPNTLIYRFKLLNGNVKCSAAGEVKGRILNQFSMDEHNNYFRIATTSDEANQKGEYVSKNNLYILDMDMKLTGSILDIAPGERIYSTRFMGDRGYMVTFKTVDPLFVLDLKNPKNPSILGALKIPGYSQYLHPYDENHIIGFGKDTVEIKNKVEGSTFTNAYYLGMKVALFDISDVNNPIEKFSVKIGDRGTDSELLWNHKALLFSKEKGLLAFPIAVYELKDTSNQEQLSYGTFAFQGAYVYNIDKDKGFELKGKITHMTEEDYKKAGQYEYSWEKMIQRILYIGDNLYTVSSGRLKANRMDNLKEIGELLIN